MFRASATTVPPASQPLANSGWRAMVRLASLLTRKRALVTTLAVLASLAIEVLSGHRPRDVIALQQPATALALSCVLLGLLLRAWAAGTLHKSTVLTQTGPYLVIRNPLYAGSFLLTVGFCTLVGTSFNLLLMLAAIGWLYVLKVRKEERTLSQRHGAAWVQYARSTPRFIPRAWPRIDFSDWRWTLWARNHEYRATIAVFAALAALKAWHDL